MVDLFSTLERKNPGGLVEAFARAFAENEVFTAAWSRRSTPSIARGPWTSSDSSPKGRTDIVFADVMLSAQEKTELLLSPDCYVVPPPQ